jgi:hypothetical protein
LNLTEDHDLKKLTLVLYSVSFYRRQGPPEEILSPGEGPVYGYGQWSSAQALGKASFSLLAAAQMAKDHFVRSAARHDGPN